MYKVLVLAYYFPPMGLSGVQRTLKFAKYLKNYNWEPTVITAGTTGYYAHDNSLLKEAEEANIKIIRIEGKEINSLISGRGTVKMPPELFRKILSRVSSSFIIPDNKTFWSRKAFKKCKEILSVEKYDLVFVSAPPFSAINTAIKLKKEFNIPVIIDYRDLWFGNQFAFYPSPLHSHLHKKMEYNALKAADKIIVTNRNMKEKILNNFKFLTFEDIFIISHGFDPKDFDELIVEHKPNNKMQITYSGIFYEYITPKYFLKAFKKLLEERPDIAADIQLNFVGILRNENRKLISKLNIQQFVKEYGYLNHKEALTKCMQSDILWMMVGYGRNADTISSGKLYEYFGTKKPIIACLPEGALKTAATDYGASFITSPNNIDEIKNVLLQVYEQYKNSTLPAPDEEFIQKHRRDFLTEQLSKQFLLSVKDFG